MKLFPMPRRRLLRQAAVAVAGVALWGGTGCQGTFSPLANTFFGDWVAVGNGRAQTFVVLDKDKGPTAYGLRFTPEALQGLPADFFEYELEMPAALQQAGIPVDHVSFDWEPQGHPPPGIYTVPHFDCHFYLIDRKTRDGILPFGPAALAAAAAPAASAIPAGYVSPPVPSEEVVPRMGVHWVDPTSPEFRGQPFTYTFIYGFNAGQMAFVEPMITKAFFESGQSASVSIPQPTTYPKPGLYPTRYRVRHDDHGNIEVILDNLVRR